jgi:hypothetical protein
MLRVAISDKCDILVMVLDSILLCLSLGILKQRHGWIDDKSAHQMAIVVTQIAIEFKPCIQKSVKRVFQIESEW